MLAIGVRQYLGYIRFVRFIPLTLAVCLTACLSTGSDADPKPPTPFEDNDGGPSDSPVTGTYSSLVGPYSIQGYSHTSAEVPNPAISYGVPGNSNTLYNQTTGAPIATGEKIHNVVLACYAALFQDSPPVHETFHYGTTTPTFSIEDSAQYEITATEGAPVGVEGNMRHATITRRRFGKSLVNVALATYYTGQTAGPGHTLDIVFTGFMWNSASPPYAWCHVVGGQTEGAFGTMQGVIQ